MPLNLPTYGTGFKALGRHCPRNGPREPAGHVLEIPRTHDVVPVEDCAGLVPVTVIATRSGTPALTRLRTAVRRKSCRSRPATPAVAQGLRPGLPEVAPPRPLPRPTEVREQIRDHAPELPLQPPHALHLRAELGVEIGGQVDHPPVVVLRGVGVEPQRPGVEVQLSTFDGEHLALASPSERVLDRGRDLKVGREILPDRRVLLALENPCRGLASFSFRMTGSRSTLPVSYPSRSIRISTASSRLMVPDAAPAACRDAT